MLLKTTSFLTRSSKKLIRLRLCEDLSRSHWAKLQRWAERVTAQTLGHTALKIQISSAKGIERRICQHSLSSR
jgi:hypothetical protein